jgi:hypothetical protein
VQLNQSKLTILGAVDRWRLLAAYQVQELLYAPTTMSTVFRHCQELRDGGYVTPAYLDTRANAKLALGGRKLALYTLAAKGARALRREGLLAGPFRSAQQSEKSRDALTHLKAANDLLLTALKAGKAVSYKTEYELRAHPVAGVVADGWVDYDVDGDQVGVHLECNLGREDETQLRDKIRRLVAYSRGPCQAFFNTPSVTIVYIVPNEARREQVITWAWAELQRLGAQDLADTFRFGTSGQEFELLRELLQS